MSQGALDRGRFETIEAYVLGTMPAEERMRFEQDLANNEVLRAEVELQRENTLAIELGGVERMLRTLGAEHAGQEGKEGGGWMQYLKYAAVVAVLLSGAVWWMSRTPAHERLYAEHFVADPGLPVPMSATDDLAFHDAMVAYKMGEYAEARAKWSPLLQADPTNDTLRYYIAIASLAEGDAAAAVPLFEGLAEEPVSAFSDKSRWFLFLAYLKTGEVAKAKAMSFDGDPMYAERVRAIKAELH
jgi:hypothetical protein